MVHKHFMSQTNQTILLYMLLTFVSGTILQASHLTPRTVHNADSLASTTLANYSQFIMQNPPISPLEQKDSYLPPSLNEHTIWGLPLEYWWIPLTIQFVFWSLLLIGLLWLLYRFLAGSLHISTRKIIFFCLLLCFSTAAPFASLVTPRIIYDNTQLIDVRYGWPLEFISQDSSRFPLGGDGPSLPYPRKFGSIWELPTDFLLTPFLLNILMWSMMIIGVISFIQQMIRFIKYKPPL